MLDMEQRLARIEGWALAQQQAREPARNDREAESEADEDASREFAPAADNSHQVNGQ